MTHTNGERPTCLFEGLTLPERFVVFAAGANAGRALNHQIDQSGHMATMIDVVVNHAETPVVLILGAYEPTVWNIGWITDTRIVAVFASGYHRQVIAGLSRDVPTLISTFENGGACGFFHVDADRLGWLNPLAQRLFNHSVDMVYLAKDGAVTIGSEVPVGAKATTSALTPPESYFDSSRSLAGLPGLEDSVRKGILRRATPMDASAWLIATTKNSTDTDVPPVAGSKRPKPKPPQLRNAYVVLKPFTYPPGLTGANSATFFIPVGAPKPIGDFGHSTIYDFNTLVCRGTHCSTQSE